MWDIPRHNTRKCCITILYHAVENTVAHTCDLCAALDEKIGYNTVKYTRAFLFEKRKKENIQRLSCIAIGCVFYGIA